MVTRRRPARHVENDATQSGTNHNGDSIREEGQKKLSDVASRAVKLEVNTAFRAQNYIEGAQRMNAGAWPFC